jgi:hypothetical protein
MSLWCLPVQLVVSPMHRRVAGDLLAPHLGVGASGWVSTTAAKEG